MRTLALSAVLATVFLSLLGSGCKSRGEEGGSEAASTMGAGKAPPFGGAEDMDRAASLWQEMRGYKNWSSYPGLEGWQPGRSPHGKVLRYYIDSVAARNPQNPGAGSIIVKENYGMEGGDLMAVTVMQKVRGYDPEDKDWFWVKFDPKGGVMKNPKGMSLAGRVAKGMDKGCIACHSNAGGDDLMFVND